MERIGRDERCSVRQVPVGEDGNTGVRGSGRRTVGVKRSIERNRTKGSAQHCHLQRQHGYKRGTVWRTAPVFRELQRCFSESDSHRTVFQENSNPACQTRSNSFDVWTAAALASPRVQRGRQITCEVVVPESTSVITQKGAVFKTAELVGRKCFKSFGQNEGNGSGPVVVGVTAGVTFRNGKDKRFFPIRRKHISGYR
ncbi:hypothetical protein CLF_103072 [Clonorchis sinensis]|uniref:Uncharacterized protein n=1 Tax=Clonorchis sinensis TaxID=79923 RepID=G7Y906_CLOSI|nr:hypothetical protein CLF_103072 [Clonorchis sinensis]